MLAEICNILELTSIIICNFLVKKYVFLEPELEAKKQRIFYLLTAVAVAASYIIWDNDIAIMVSIIAIGINIFLSRKNHRVLGVFLMFPIPGIINGIVVPTIVVPPYVCSMSERGGQYYQLIVYAILAVLFLMFCIKGKNWRMWFRETMYNRSLPKWEKILLYITGCLMLVFSNEVDVQTKLGDTSLSSDNILTDTNGWIWASRTTLFIVICSLTSLIMTIAVIILIMEESRRAFYHEKVSDMQFHIITMMADIVESRDENTGGHIKRTAIYVEMIARELLARGLFPEVLDKQYIEDMVVAAPPHDIGKIHIPDTILNKPGKLTAEEFEIMKTHTTAGRDLLRRAKDELGEMEYLNLALDMAAYHHEWWDGSGYPEGRSGEDIPVCARIMAVADVFDALTSKRCYKSAMPLEKAYSIIREESGTHFDERVVDAFFAVTDKIETVLEN
jgi:HD-GYP domain-containing protein (c-di-GMP phosphodiesterase class II)